MEQGKRCFVQGWLQRRHAVTGIAQRQQDDSGGDRRQRLVRIQRFLPNDSEMWSGNKLERLLCVGEQQEQGKDTRPCVLSFG